MTEVKKLLAVVISVLTLLALLTAPAGAETKKHVHPAIGTSWKPGWTEFRAQVTSTVIVVGSTPVYGTCTNGNNLYNNAGIVGCQANGGGGGTPGGSSGQIQYNNASAFGGFTMSGDCTTVTSTGVITCLTVNGATPVTGPGSAVSNDIATFNGTTGHIIADSGRLATSIPKQANVVTFSLLAKANSAAVVGAGTGGTYTTNDTITMATTGGTCSTAPVFTVTASAGLITSLAVQTAGSCTVLPNNNPATQASSSGSGTGGTFIVTWGAINQTYTPSAGIVAADVWALGGGGGGGAGAAQVASTAASGGGGGGGASLMYQRFNATQIGGSVTVAVAVGGIPVVPPVATSANAGTNGKVGGNTTFGSLLTAFGGGGGAGSTTAGGNATSGTQGAAGGVGGAAGAASPTNIFGGAGGGTGAGAGTAGSGFLAGGGGPGGGSGAGLTSGSGTASGGNGGAAFINGVSTASGGTGGAVNTSGNPGSTTANLFAGTLVGSGAGGGGTAATQTIGGSGGCAGNGAGGGGGGSVITGTTSAAGFGGCGGSGAVSIVELF